MSIGYAYCTDALLALKAERESLPLYDRLFLMPLTALALYNLDVGWGFQLLFALSSQVIGMSLAGVFRRFLVWYVTRSDIRLISH